MVTTIVAAVRTFSLQDKSRQRSISCGVCARARLPHRSQTWASMVMMMMMVEVVVMTEDGISEMPLPATIVFDHLPTCQVPASAEQFAFVPASAERFPARFFIGRRDFHPGRNIYYLLKQGSPPPPLPAPQRAQKTSC